MEFVFVVPREALFPECYPHGFVPFAGDSQEASIGKDSVVRKNADALRTQMEARIAEHGFYVERERAERTPAWKQIIPYTLVVREGQVLCLTRTKKGGEARLHDKLSIGVGGHINPVDQTPNQSTDSGSDALDPSRNPIPAASHREVIEEELIVEGAHSWRTLGLLNDDSNPVGAVHLGWVQSLVVQGDVRVREVDQLEGHFRSVDELQNMLASGANFETWSSLLIPSLGRLLLSTSSTTATPETPSKDGAQEEGGRHPQSASSHS